MGKNKKSKENSNNNNTKREIKLKHRKDKKLNISKKMSCEDKDHLFQPTKEMSLKKFPQPKEKTFYTFPPKKPFFK